MRIIYNYFLVFYEIVQLYFQNPQIRIEDFELIEF